MLKYHAINDGVAQNEFLEFLGYVAGFYNNMGPYHAFGSMKFIPEIPSSKFLQILNSNPIGE